MLKSCFILFIGISLLPHLIVSSMQCCRTLYTLIFKTRNNNICSDFSAKNIERKYIYKKTYNIVSYSNNTSCEITVCADGTPSESYCGKGSCAIFGCICDGGCRLGDPEERFQQIYTEDKVYDVEFKMYTLN